MPTAMQLCPILAFAAITQSLQITNTTPPVALTSTFYNGSSAGSLTELDIGLMTYYIDPKDVSNTKHLWLGIGQRINATKIGETQTSLQSDIFDSNFIQYNPDNNNIKNILPLTISNSSDRNNDTSNIDDVLGNFMCTSPTTKDIITCWLNATGFLTPLHIERYIYNIQCKMFFVSTNTFSEVLNITAPYNSPDSMEDFNYPGGVVCFNDSYWIPYITIIYPVSVTSYSALIGLDGKIIFAQRELNLNFSGTMSPPLLATKGVTPYKIGNKEYESFIIEYEVYNTSTNVSNISAAYGYYTDIHDDSPIYIYQDHDINHQYKKAIYKGPSNMELYPSLSINFTKNCCYINVYFYDHQVNNYYVYDVYGIFNDNNGNSLNISQQSYFEDILLIKGALDDVVPMILDLPMISTDSSHYFMITFGNYSSNEIYNSDKVIAAVFYLTYNSAQNVYNLESAGEFNTIKLVNQQNSFEDVTAYIMPDTNELFYSWTEFVDSAGTPFMLYGQTWTIN